MAQSPDGCQSLTDNGGPKSPFPQVDSRQDTAPAPARAPSQSHPGALSALEESDNTTAGVAASFGSDYIPFTDDIGPPAASPIPEAIATFPYRQWSNLPSGFGVHPHAPGPSPNAPTRPRPPWEISEGPFSSVYPTADSPPQAPAQSLYATPSFGAYQGKRKLDRFPSRSTSPPHARIKVEKEPTSESQTISTRITDDKPRHTIPVASKPERASGGFIRDPQDENNGWQILCLNEDFGRRKLCGYLGFSDTSQMCRWEESYPTRWKYIQDLTSASLEKVVVTDVLRIICNDGGVGAEVLEFVEGLKPWARFSNDGQPLKKDNTEKVASLCGIGDRGANETLQISMAIVWLIRESSATQLQPRFHSTTGNVRAHRFPDSGYYPNSPYFWYAPEDVNRAFWYLSNLRHHPADRQEVDHQPAKQVKKGVDAGLASLHNSVSKGEWAGRILRKDIVNKLGEAVDEQAEKMKSQLLYLRKWAYKTNPFFSKFGEGELDDLLNIARRYIKTHDSDMDGFYKACVMVELYVWSWAHPGILSDAIDDMLADFEELLRWLHNHSATVGDDEGVGALLNGAVRVIAAGDRKTYFSRRAMIKETVYNAKFRN